METIGLTKGTSLNLSFTPTADMVASSIAAMAEAGFRGHTIDGCVLTYGSLGLHKCRDSPGQQVTADTVLQQKRPHWNIATQELVLEPIVKLDVYPRRKLHPGGSQLGELSL